MNICDRLGPDRLWLCTGPLSVLANQEMDHCSALHCTELYCTLKTELSYTLCTANYKLHFTLHILLHNTHRTLHVVANFLLQTFALGGHSVE